MALAFTIVIALVLVVLGLVGYIRDLRRGLLALIGTLAGVILVSFWAAPWGLALAGSFVGGDPQRMIFIVSCALLLWSALVVGYGGGMLLGRAKDRPPFQQRLVGALLGALNGVLIVAFLLRFAVTSQPSFAAMIESSPLAKILFDSLPLLFLGVTVADHTGRAGARHYAVRHPPGRTRRARRCARHQRQRANPAHRRPRCAG